MCLCSRDEIRNVSYFEQSLFACNNNYFKHRKKLASVCYAASLSIPTYLIIGENKICGYIGHCTNRKYTGDT